MKKKIYFPISFTSMVPIYEQIVNGVKNKILSGELEPGDVLPSVRSFANDHKVSALTVKKAYDRLEEEGLTETVHGKGTYVTAANMSAVQEMRTQEIEEEFRKVIEKARNSGLPDTEILEVVRFLLEE